MTFAEAIKELKSISMNAEIDCEIRFLFRYSNKLHIEISFNKDEIYEDYFLITIQADKQNKIVMDFDTDTACREMFSEKLKIASKVCKVFETNSEAVLELLK